MMNCFRNMPSNNFEKCPLPNCPCDPSMNFDQKTEHVLQYATKNLFLNDLEEDPSERTIPNIWMTKWIFNFSTSYSHKYLDFKVRFQIKKALALL